eukprot:scaffold22060_cov68-Phaeocystis_antarctica.AAC.7
MAAPVRTTSALPDSLLLCFARASRAATIEGELSLDMAAANSVAAVADGDGGDGGDRLHG